MKGRLFLLVSYLFCSGCDLWNMSPLLKKLISLVYGSSKGFMISVFIFFYFYNLASWNSHLYLTIFLSSLHLIVSHSFLMSQYLGNGRDRWYMLLSNCRCQTITGLSMGYIVLVVFIVQMYGKIYYLLIFMVKLNIFMIG